MDRDQQAVDKFNISKSANTLAAVLAAAYAWQLYGILVGIGTLIILWFVRRWTANAIALSYIERAVKRGEEPNTSKLLRLTMASRWAWVIVTYVALALSVAQVCTGDQCKSIWN